MACDRLAVAAGRRARRTRARGDPAALAHEPLGDAGLVPLRAGAGRPARRARPAGGGSIRPRARVCCSPNLEELATGRAARALASLPPVTRGRRERVLAARAPGASRSVRAEFEELVASFGYMAEADEELSQPRWEEDPSIPLALLKAAIAVDGRPSDTGRRRSAEERRVLAAAGWRAGRSAASSCARAATPGGARSCATC